MITESFQGSEFTSYQYFLALVKWGEDNDQRVNFLSQDNIHQMSWYYEDESGPLDETEGLPSKTDLEALIPQADAENKLQRLRLVRNEMLSDTDWWAVPDRTMTQEQIDYRQALRDITSTYTSLDDVIWPTKP